MGKHIQAAVIRHGDSAVLRVKHGDEICVRQLTESFASAAERVYYLRAARLAGRVAVLMYAYQDGITLGINKLDTVNKVTVLAVLFRRGFRRIVLTYHCVVERVKLGKGAQLL